MATSIVDVHQLEKLRPLGKSHESAARYAQKMSIVQFVSVIENLKISAKDSPLKIIETDQTVDIISHLTGCGSLNHLFFQ